VQQQPAADAATQQVAVGNGGGIPAAMNRVSRLESGHIKRTGPAADPGMTKKVMGSAIPSRQFRGVNKVVRRWDAKIEGEKP